MAHSAYPQLSDLTTYLNGIGLVRGDGSSLSAVLPLQTFLDSAVAAWERRTGYQPFLAGAASARQLDPPGPNRGSLPALTGLNRGGGTRLSLDGGLAAEPTSVVVGFTSTDPGTTLTPDTQYWLGPYNALAKGNPYTWLEFISPQWGAAKSVKITGQWGYSTTVPDDAWEGIMAYASWLAWPGIVGQLTGGLVEWTEQATERYGPSPFKHFRDYWEGSLDRIVSRYQRIVL
jgi:hypothetical protein